MKILNVLTILQIFITFLIFNTESAAINFVKAKAAPTILSLECSPGYELGPFGKKCRKVFDHNAEKNKKN
jgi:hypothetical protein